MTDTTATTAFDISCALRERLPDIGAVRQHKMLYYAQGWHLAFTGRPLFPEVIEAWDKGPVVADLWRVERAGKVVDQNRTLNDEELSTVEFVVRRYGALNARELISLSHQEAPWLNAYDRTRRTEITLEALQTFFEQDPEQKRLAPIADEIERRWRAPLEIGLSLHRPPELDWRSERDRVTEMLNSRFASE